MIIKVDIDNTIRDMSEQMLSLYNDLFFYKLENEMTKEDIKEYDVNISFPLFKERGLNVKDYFFNINADTVYSNAKPLKDAIEGINLLKENGHTIILVSYQPTQDSKERTIRWLFENNINYDALVLTNKEDKTIITADYIIDDNPKFLDMDSAKKVCIDWAYNRNREYDYRVKSIKEFAEIIK